MNRTIDPLSIEGVGFVLILLVLPLVSYGTIAENELVWVAGLVLLLIGSLIPLVVEFWVQEDEEENGENGTAQENGENSENGTEQEGEKDQSTDS